ncbi:hypothetical protein BGZ67_007570 [Mortierella alpina]|nr:hypothetical protein BGZ67_007570 [Mortierella alpina]
MTPTEAAWTQGGKDDSATYKVEVKEHKVSHQQRNNQRPQEGIKRQQSAPALSEFPMPPKPTASPRTPRSHAAYQHRQQQQQQNASPYPDWQYQPQQHEQQRSEADGYGAQGVM